MWPNIPSSWLQYFLLHHCSLQGGVFFLVLFFTKHPRCLLFHSSIRQWNDQMLQVEHLWLKLWFWRLGHKRFTKEYSSINLSGEVKGEWGRGKREQLGFNSHHRHLNRSSRQLWSWEAFRSSSVGRERWALYPYFGQSLNGGYLRKGAWVWVRCL